MKLPAAYDCELTGQPFDKCDLCEGDLLVADHSYHIVKARINRSGMDAETVLEAAFCDDCLQSEMPKLSDESLEAVMIFRGESLQNGPLALVSPASGVPDRCCFCHQSTDQPRTFSLHAEVQTDGHGQPQLRVRPSVMMMVGTPVAFCSDCNEALEGRLSSSTRERFQDFYNNLIGPDPSIELDDAPLPMLF